MTDSDLLARAAQALREAHTGERAGSGFTRARVMNTLHRERRRRVLRWAVASPLASVLLVGSAWAQSTGKWPVIWQAVASVFVAAPAHDDAPPAPPRRPEPPRPSEPRPVVEPPPSASDASSEELPAPAPPTPVVQATPGEPAREAPRRGARQLRRTRAPVPSELERSEPSSVREEPSSDRREPPVPDRDRELTTFRAAHDLHFSGDRPREAIDAYAAYLRQYPQGRFVPEARYNGALDQIKLGHTSAARDALEPFAAGQYGSYRQKEARQLLDALANPRTGR